MRYPLRSPIFPVIVAYPNAPSAWRCQRVDAHIFAPHMIGRDVGDSVVFYNHCLECGPRGNDALIRCHESCLVAFNERHKDWPRFILQGAHPSVVACSMIATADTCDLPISHRAIHFYEARLLSV